MLSLGSAAVPSALKPLVFIEISSSNVIVSPLFAAFTASARETYSLSPIFATLCKAVTVLSIASVASFSIHFLVSVSLYMFPTAVILSLTPKVVSSLAK